jgi:hypothetical protein
LNPLAERTCFSQVSASNTVFTLARRVEIVASPWSGTSHLSIADAITVIPRAFEGSSVNSTWGVAAVQIQHTAQFDKDVVTVSAEVPGDA